MTCWYRFCRFLYRLYFRVYHRGRVYHADRVPPTGAAILAGNHLSFLDPPFFGLGCDREAYFLARDTLFRNPLAGWLLRSWNCVPLKRDGGDLAGMRTVLRMLGENKAVVMFPEGTRSRDGQLQRARSGIGMIVARAAVPVVPMRIFGTRAAMPRGVWLPRPVAVTIVYGEPFRPAALDQVPGRRGEELKAAYQSIADEVMERITALKPPASRAI